MTKQASVFIFLTRSCDLACRHCYVSASPHLTEAMSVVTFESTVRRFLNEGVVDFRLTGGEPTAHPNFRLMLSHLGSLDIRPRLITNGIRLMRMQDPAGILRQVDSCWISAYGITDAQHNAVSSSPCTLTETIAFASRAAEYCNKVGLSVLLTDSVGNDLKLFLERLVAIGLRRVRFLFAEPAGRAVRTRAVFAGSGQIVERANAVLRILEPFGHDGAFDFLTLGDPFDLKSNYSNPRQSCMLNGRAMWAVAPGGEVYSCCYNVYKPDHRIDMTLHVSRQGSFSALPRTQFAEICDGLKPSFWGELTPSTCPISAITLVPNC